MFQPPDIVLMIWECRRGWGGDGGVSGDVADGWMVMVIDGGGGWIVWWMLELSWFGAAG